VTASTVILDRDGVINIDSDAYIKSPEEWQPIAGSLEAIARLHQQGFRVVVVTNQSGVARGLFSEATLAAIHDKMQHVVRASGGEIAAIYACIHGPDSDCLCRKPKPGLFHAVGRDFGIDLSQVFAVGDSYRDIQASEAVNAKPLLVKTGKGQQTLAAHPNFIHPIFDTLYDAVSYILTPR
jgi:D-glycero-D-manno-heptose 1,7-bisphosphate phosphatase